VLQEALEEEMTYELGYSRYDWKNKDSANSRNGHAKKTVKSRLGDIELQIPRDTCGEFEPVIVKKNERRLTGSIEDNILGIYAKGMSNRDIYNSMRGMYGVRSRLRWCPVINRQDSARCPGVAEPASGSHISHTVLGRDGVFGSAGRAGNQEDCLLGLRRNPGRP